MTLCLSVLQLQFSSSGDTRTVFPEAARADADSAPARSRPPSRPPQASRGGPETALCSLHRKGNLGAFPGTQRDGADTSRRAATPGREGLSLPGHMAPNTRLPLFRPRHGHGQKSACPPAFPARVVFFRCIPGHTLYSCLSPNLGHILRINTPALPFLPQHSVASSKADRSRGGPPCTRPFSPRTALCPAHTLPGLRGPDPSRSPGKGSHRRRLHAH